MLNRLLHLSLGSISFFLLFNILLNLTCIDSGSLQSRIFNLSLLDNLSDLLLDVSIREILVIKDELRVLSPQRGIIERCLS